jgi:hypothetical protein
MYHIAPLSDQALSFSSYSAAKKDPRAPECGQQHGSSMPHPRPTKKHLKNGRTRVAPPKTIHLPIPTPPCPAVVENSPLHPIPPPSPRDLAIRKCASTERQALQQHDTLTDMMHVDDHVNAHPGISPPEAPPRLTTPTYNNQNHCTSDNPHATPQRIFDFDFTGIDSPDHLACGGPQ